MKTFVLSALVLAVFGFVVTVSAEPVKLSKEQMASIVAGKITETQVNGGGQTPKGEANGVPSTNTNPTGKAPAGQNK